MADFSTISRIAKILARATSPEEGEARTALDHAYKRMVRDGVTLQDLLTLPEAELFQNTLVRLVEVILSNQTDLSPSAKRAAYAEYMRLIVTKFSGVGAERTQQSSEGEQSREEAAKAYRERNGYSEQRGSRRRDAPRENVKTENQNNNKSFSQKNNKTFFGKSVPPILAWIWNLVCSPFAPGGVMWHGMRSPVAMIRLLLACMLWGMGFAIVLMTVAAIAHVLTKTNPLWDVHMRLLFPMLTAIGTFIRMRSFMRTV